jgi:hypothetical protein
MHRSLSNPPARRRSQRPAALWLAALALPLLGAGCSTAGPAGNARFGCYDFRGRLEPTITNKAECDFRDWAWRERP